MKSFNFWIYLIPFFQIGIILDTVPCVCTVTDIHCNMIEVVLMLLFMSNKYMLYKEMVSLKFSSVGENS
jgi:hypothetical protein